MAIETGTYISDLDAANPTGSDAKSTMDNHLRLVKSTIKVTFPAITGAVTATHGELNYMVGATIQPAMKDGSNLATPAPGSTGTAIATVDYANALAFNAALPAQPGGATTYHISSTLGVTTWAADTLPASAAEVKAGTNAVKPLTPATALAAFGFSSYAQTADQTITSAGALTIAHGLSRAPALMFAFIKSTTAEHGYSVGDTIATPITSSYPGGGSNQGVSVTADATNIYVRFADNASVFPVAHKTTGAGASATNTSWSFFLRVLA